MNKSNKNESSSERFKRLATHRTNEILKKLKILGNCSNRQIYSYSEKEVDTIFLVIEKKVKEIKMKFQFPNNDKFKL